MALFHEHLSCVLNPESLPFCTRSRPVTSSPGRKWKAIGRTFPRPAYPLDDWQNGCDWQEAVIDIETYTDPRRATLTAARESRQQGQLNSLEKSRDKNGRLKQEAEAESWQIQLQGRVNGGWGQFVNQQLEKLDKAISWKIQLWCRA